MSKERSCEYTISAGVKAAHIPESSVLQMIKTTVNKAYDRNLTIGEGLFANRFCMFTVNGKIATENDLVEVVKTNPESIQQILPIVGLTETKGEDVAFVVLQSEIETKMTDEPLLAELKELIGTPPNISLDQLIARLM